MYTPINIMEYVNDKEVKDNHTIFVGKFPFSCIIHRFILMIIIIFLEVKILYSQILACGNDIKKENNIK